MPRAALGSAATQADGHAERARIERHVGARARRFDVAARRVAQRPRMACEHEARRSAHRSAVRGAILRRHARRAGHRAGRGAAAQVDGSDPGTVTVLDSRA
jgi:hypothetical protein